MKPLPTDTTPSAWLVEIKGFEIVQANVAIIDSVALRHRPLSIDSASQVKRFDYSLVRLKDVEIAGSFSAALGRNILRIHKMNATAQDREFSLQDFAGEFLLSKQEARISNAKIATAQSRLRLDAHIKNIDVTKIQSLRQLESIPLELKLVADKLDARELRQFFFPHVDFLDRNLAVSLSANGSLGLLTVEQLTVQTPRSYVRLGGALSNLHQPNDLWLDIYSNESKVNPHDLLEYLPGLHLPDLNFLGEANLSLTFAGTPREFKSHLNLHTNVGSIAGESRLRIRGAALNYDATLRTTGIDLARLVGDPALRSSLSSRITLHGSGTSLRTMAATIKAEIDSSNFYGLPIRRSVIVVDAFEGVIRSHASLRSGQTTYDLSGKFDAHRADTIAYSLNGTVNSLDLAQIIRDKHFESDLSFAVDAGGEWRSNSGRIDTLRVGFFPSAFGRDKFSQGNILLRHVAGDQLDRTLTVWSDPIDLRLEGKFDPFKMSTTLRYAYELVAGNVGYRVQTLDSLRSHRRMKPMAFDVPVPNDSGHTDVKFSILARDLYPVGVLANIPLFGNLESKGMMAGNLEDLVFQSTSTIGEFGYTTPQESILVRHSALDLNLTGISRSHTLEALGASLEFHAESMGINGLTLHGPSASAIWVGDSASFDVSSDIDSTVQLEAGGTASLVGRKLALTLPTFKVGLDPYEFENSGSVLATIGRDGIMIDTLLLEHEAEAIKAHGFLSPKVISDCELEVSGFLLTDLQSVLRRSSIAKEVRDLGGFVSATGKFRGSLDHPNVALDFSAEGVRLRDRVFGRLDGRLSYFEHLLTMFVEFKSRSMDSLLAPDLMLTGSVPVELTLASEPLHELTGDMDITVRARALDLAFLDPFIPEVANLSGRLDGTMRLRGPVNAPAYDGALSIRGAKFLFEPVGIVYQLDGDLQPSGDHINLSNVSVKNIPQDYAGGAMNVTGTFTMHGLSFGDFNFRTDGSLMVMKETFHSPGSKFYGDVVAQTGEGGISWQGNMRRSLVRGELFSRNAQLVLPPEREVFVMLNRNVTVTFVDDTTRIVSVPQASTKSFLTPRAGTVGDKGDERAQNTTATQAAPSFLDGIDYDLAIETKGPTQLRFIFNGQTNEELFADIQGRLYFVRNPSTKRLTGELLVGSTSYYNLFKKFQASGKLIFTGDPLNPELNITARYEGIHDTATNRATETLGKGEKVAVILTLTGPRNKVSPKWDIEFPNDPEQAKKRADVESDAISFIFTGQFRDELTDQQKRTLIGSNIGYGFASGVLTGPLSEGLRKFTSGYVQSVDLIYYGGAFEKSADVRFTGQVGEAVVRAGGRVLSDLTNTNVSVEFPVSALVGSGQLHNLILTLERRVEGLDNIDDRLRSSSNWARLFYRFTF
ncbi:MAG: hypothetical protein HY966_06575 [Ignavibacteriales bacterium]|nr:hypothetical protein [Ignavibacteriales bacterium]